MRFGLVTTFYPPYNFGGDGINVQRLARALVQRGHHVSVLFDPAAYQSLTAKDLLPCESSDDGVKVVPIRRPWGVLSPFLVHQTGRPLLTRHLLQPMLEQDFDVIHYHNVSLVGGPGIFQYGNAIKLFTAHEHWLVCPTSVLWRHGQEPCDGRECFRCQLSYLRPPQLWRYTSLLENALQHIDVFFALSEFSRQKHREFGFPREMTVLPCFLPDLNGLQETDFLARPHARPYFLFVGRLEKIKGLDDVLPLFRDYPEGDLLIAGQGNYEETLRSLAAGNNRVKFLGNVDSQDLPRYYRHAIATLVPSVCFETFGATIIESFQQSTPVIARRLGPSTEMVQQSEGGLLFENPAELRTAMSRLQHDKELRSRAGEAARQAYLARWSEDVVLPQYLDIVTCLGDQRKRMVKV